MKARLQKTIYCMILSTHTCRNVKLIRIDQRLPEESSIGLLGRVVVQTDRHFYGR